MLTNRSNALCLVSLLNVRKCLCMSVMHTSVVIIYVYKHIIVSLFVWLLQRQRQNHVFLYVLQILKISDKTLCCHGKFGLK